MKSNVSALISIAAVLGVATAWQCAGTFGWADSLFLPAPSEIIGTARGLWEHGYGQVPLWQHIAISLGRALVAFVTAVALGVPIGLAMGQSRVLAAMLDPFVQFLRPLPKIALVPLAIVWLGIGESSKFALIFVATVLNVVVGSAASVANIPGSRVRVARSLGLSKRKVFLHVILPNSLPDIFTSIRIAVGIGWTSLIAAEMVASTTGVGWMIVNASSYLRTDVVILGILILGGLGYALDWMLVRAQQRYVPWAGKE
ncbi:ABC transporter permease [Cupriavidus sp. 2TAF22]|uniref:ABC transporter permease n=1 Tax=unclassified Cupriavidus TaxID=2640874 RepID=UPI003F90B1C1